MEGINYARDEADKEAALRQEAETQMSELRAQLYDQARKLASLNVEQKADHDLQARSTELRSSVYGMEQQLSSLKIERDLAMAEMQELSAS